MPDFLIALFSILIFLAATFGWGRLTVSLFVDDQLPGYAFMMVFGLGVWIFFGGILNTASLAFPLSIHIILALGLAFSFAFFYMAIKKKPVTETLNDLVAHITKDTVSYWSSLLFIGLILLFLVFTQMPAKAFNFYDDLHVYLPRLTRMLQTGSLGGNPFDVFGVDSLGAQAFLQSFFVNYFSIFYANAFDAIICFILSLILLREMGRRFKVHWIGILASLLTFAVINSQFTNISSLYSGSLMILATVYSSLIFTDHLNSENNKRAFAAAATIALFMTSLVSLKTTLAIFILAYFSAYFSGLLYLSEHKLRIVRSILYTVLAGTLLLTPWILLSLPNYLTALHLALNENTAIASESVSRIDFFEKISDYSSNDFMGGNFLSGNYLEYGLVLGLLIVAGATSLYLLIKARDIPYRLHLVTIFAACIAAVISCIANVILFDPMNAIRYCIPILIPVAAVTVLMLTQNTTLALRSQNHSKRAAPFQAGGVVVLGAALIIGGVFFDDLLHRGQRAYELRTLLSVPRKEIEDPVNMNALSKSSATWVQSLQHKIAEGRPILAFLSLPSYLDFSRNPIFTIVEAGFVNPWFNFPLRGDSELARKYLVDKGVHHVIFQVRSDPGYMIPGWLHKNFAQSQYWTYQKLGERSTDFINTMRYLANNSLLIHADTRVVIFDISQRAD